MTAMTDLLDNMDCGRALPPADFSKLLRVRAPRSCPDEDLQTVRALFRDRVRPYEHFSASRYEAMFSGEVLDEWVRRLLEGLEAESDGALRPGDWRRLMWDSLMGWKIAHGASHLQRLESQVERNVYLDQLPTFLLVGSRHESWLLDEHAGRLGSLVTDFDVPTLLEAFAAGVNRLDTDWLLEHRLGSSGWNPRNHMWSPDYAAVEILAHVWCRSLFEYQAAAYHLDVAEPERCHRRNLKSTLHLIQVNRRAEAEGLTEMSWESKTTILNLERSARTFDLPLIQVQVDIPKLKQI